MRAIPPCRGHGVPPRRPGEHSRRQNQEGPWVATLLSSGGQQAGVGWGLMFSCPDSAPPVQVRYWHPADALPPGASARGPRVGLACFPARPYSAKHYLEAGLAFCSHSTRLGDWSGKPGCVPCVEKHLDTPCCKTRLRRLAAVPDNDALSSKWGLFINAEQNYKKLLPASDSQRWYHYYCPLCYLPRCTSVCV